MARLLLRSDRGDLAIEWILGIIGLIATALLTLELVDKEADTGSENVGEAVAAATSGEALGELTSVTPLTPPEAIEPGTPEGGDEEDDDEVEDGDSASLEDLETTRPEADPSIGVIATAEDNDEGEGEEGTYDFELERPDTGEGATSTLTGDSAFEQYADAVQSGEIFDEVPALIALREALRRQDAGETLTERDLDIREMAMNDPNLSADERAFFESAFADPTRRDIDNDGDVDDDDRIALEEGYQSLDNLLGLVLGGAVAAADIKDYVQNKGNFHDTGSKGQRGGTWLAGPRNPDGPGSSLIRPAAASTLTDALDAADTVLPEGAGGLGRQFAGIVDGLDIDGIISGAKSAIDWVSGIDLLVSPGDAVDDLARGAVGGIDSLSVAISEWGLDKLEDMGVDTYTNKTLIDLSASTTGTWVDNFWDGTFELAFADDRAKITAYDSRRDVDALWSTLGAGPAANSDWRTIGEQSEWAVPLGAGAKVGYNGYRRFVKGRITPKRLATLKKRQSKAKTAVAKIDRKREAARTALQDAAEELASAPLTTSAAVRQQLQNNVDRLQKAFDKLTRQLETAQETAAKASGRVGIGEVRVIK